MLKAQDIFYHLDASGNRIDSVSCNSFIETDSDPMMHPVEENTVSN